MSQSVEFNPLYQGISFTEVEITAADLMPAEMLVAEYSRVILQDKMMPKNFIKLSEASKAFREALTAQLLTDVTDHDSLIDTFTGWLQMTPPGVSTLKTLQEYSTAITFAVERKDLTVKIIKRGQPGETSPAVWLIVDAMKKGMPGVMYQNLMINSRFAALRQLEEQQQNGYLKHYLQ